jgi:hypothetical protein
VYLYCMIIMALPVETSGSLTGRLKDSIDSVRFFHSTDSSYALR